MRFLLQHDAVFESRSICRVSFVITGHQAEMLLFSDPRHQDSSPLLRQYSTGRCRSPEVKRLTITPEDLRFGNRTPSTPDWMFSSIASTYFKHIKRLSLLESTIEEATTMEQIHQTFRVPHRDKRLPPCDNMARKWHTR